MYKELKQQMKPLIKYIKPYRWMYLSVFLIMLVSIGFNLLTPLVTKTIIDKALLNRNMALFIKFIIFYLSIFLIHGGFRILSSYLFFLLSEKIFLQLRRDVFRKLLQCDAAFFNKYKTGDLMSRVMNDIGTVKNLIVSTLMQFFINIIMFIGTFAMLFYLSWEVALFVIVTIPGYILIIKKYGKSLRVETKRNREVYAEVNSYLQEYLPHIKAVQAYNSEERIESNFSGELSNLYQSNIALEILKLKGNLFISGFSYLCPFFVLLYSGIMIINGFMSVGGWVAISSYLNQVYGPIRSLVNMNLNLNMTLASVARITEILQYEPERKMQESLLPLTGFKDQIRFKNVDLAYGEKKILHDINFAITKGERVAIVGETGEGKSTIIDMMLGFKMPTNGQILINGHEIDEYDITEIRKLFSVVFQDTSIFKGTILDNIYLFDDEKAAQDQILQSSEIRKWLDKIELSHRETVEHAGKDLSGGQKQIVGILRSMARESDILIFDEPTSSQDAISEKFFKNILQEFGEEKTIIVISHRFSLTTDVDKIILLKNGRIIACGSHRELVQNCSLYSELYEAQRINDEEDSYAI